MSVRLRLRAATDAQHRALHDAEPFARIAQGRIDRKGYGTVLAMLHRYHCALTPACIAGARALGEPGLADAQAARLRALRRDLDFMGVAASSGEVVAAPDPGFAIGCLYTVQGSTLGGKVIARQLEMLLPGEDGRRFFLGGGDDGLLWQTLCARLEDCGQDFARLEAGSRHAFARFAEMLLPAG